MRSFFQKLWVKVRLTVIIILSIVIGAVWMYNYQSFAVMKCEAEATWTHVQQIQEQRKEIKEVKDVGGEVESKDETSMQDTPNEGAAEESKISSPSSGNEIIDTIYEVAKEKQFPNPEILVRIAKAESSFDPCAKNPNSSATGLFQILDMHGLTKDERCNPKIATAWAIDNFAGGRPWASSKHKWNI